MGKGKPPTKFEKEQRFHHFRVMGPAPIKITPGGYKYPCVSCLCDCGTTFITTTKQIYRGYRKSCGCKSPSKTGHPMQVIARSRFSGYKNSAKRRGIDWNLDFEDFFYLIYSRCAYCKTETFAKATLNKHKETIGGIDRKDSSKGYEPQNVVPCCQICNRAKGSMPYDTWMSWLDIVGKIYSTK